MFKRILIANRGEIAVRVIRTCREMGIETVAVYSEADREALHVRLADRAICIGPAAADASYLYIPNIISAAEISGCDAIHPGYGFLAENTYFAEVCEAAGITFIGPSPEAIEKMGDKARARQIMRKYGVPCLPGTEECVKPDDPNLPKIARKIGYPLLVKATGGGGGKGMRVVRAEEELASAIQAAQAEARAAFGNEGVYLERYVEKARHIEVQIIGDRYGDATSFPERDCSIQRRHQKLVEESPSPAVSEKIRRKLGKAARLAAKAVRYVTVGTVEFLLDVEEEEFYFIEMNTRIQVEHGITELVTGLDLIREQIRTAAGEKIGYKWDDVPLSGHALECRINAENPEKGFLPSAGRVEKFVPPGGPGVRLDTHVFAGYEVPPHYDSLLAKLMVHGNDRPTAIRRMERALREFSLNGVATTIPFHQAVMADEHFRRGDYTTRFVSERLGLPA